MCLNVIHYIKDSLHNEEIKQAFCFGQAGEDGEITAEEQVQMLLDAKLQCLHKVSTDDPAGRHCFHSTFISHSFN